MAVYNSSLLDISDPATGTPQPGAFEQREADFKRVLDAALDPALDMCDQMAAMRQNAWDRNVFGVNCRETVLTALEGFGFTASRVREIEDDEARLVEELTVEHVSDACCRRGCQACYLTLPPRGTVRTLAARFWTGINRHVCERQGRKRRCESARYELARDVRQHR